MKFASVIALLLGLTVLPADALTITYTGPIDCQGLRTGDCLEQLVLPALGHGPALNLRANTMTDTVHGSVSMSYCRPPCLSTVTVIIYETDDPPRDKRATTFKRPLMIPTEAAIQAQLRTLAPR